MEIIKETLERGNTIIVCDTNVYLHMYSYSPNYSKYALSCLNVIKDYLYMPTVIEIEYKKHYKSCFKQMSKRILDSKDTFIRQIAKAQSDSLSINISLKKLGFDEIEELNKSLDQYYTDMIKSVDEFFGDREQVMTLLANSWGGVDYVFEIYRYIVEQKHVFPALSPIELYRLCEECEKRYNNKLPPGYKDDKGKKNGLNKYSDFIWWKEVIRYAKKNKCDVFLVTNDIKEDWWSKDDKGNSILRFELVSEFEKTGQKLYGFTSESFYELIGKQYNISVPDMFEYALDLTDDDYCKRISDKVFDTIVDQLIYNGMYYIDKDSAHLGLIGIDEFEIVSYSYNYGTQEKRDGNNIYYILVYDVVLSGYSYDYWGRDDETKNIITSPGDYHEFEGYISVSLKREANILVDFENEDSFEVQAIIDGSFEESLYEPWDESDEMEFIKGYTTCPKCGNTINYHNDAGDGFCLDCKE